ncbi:MAG: SpoIID/LytB domain-containing protein [Bacteroidales bacterium]|jgi:SpoIID/LytB domain protein|nr:SpoIID/LytB domain-containing protein [Bacteroidales bacterium]HOS45753.1 SpoIID/LytB domain-containing protein [Paludibacter sp.]
MEQPTVSIGILKKDRIRFNLTGNYVLNEKAVRGTQTVFFEGGKINWNGKLYDELFFETKDDESVFILKDVIIGINFHWERKEDQRFQGSLKFIVEDDAITAINIIGIEDYLVSVISSEMSASSSMELLKAHAVISRSWLLAQIERRQQVERSVVKPNFVETEDKRIVWYDREDHVNFDVCADDHCQRYQGIGRLQDNYGHVREAVFSTRGQVLSYNNQIVDARFSKCCGGVTEEFRSCWDDIEVPYLIKVRDAETDNNSPDLRQEKEVVKWISGRPEAFCNTTDTEILSQVLNNYDQDTRDFYRWSVSYQADELSALIYKRSGIDFGAIVDLIPMKRGVSGRIIELKIVGTKKTMVIGKELEIRRILSESHLYSSAFYVEKTDDTFVLHGAGWGHGVGLCQIGAAVMGAKGYTFDEILRHYYVGASIKNIY